MKKGVCILFVLLAFLESLGGTTPSETDSSKSAAPHFEISRNSFIHSSTIYLVYKGERTDSLQFQNVDLNFDSVFVYKDSLLYYSFLFCNKCMPILTRRMQYLLTYDGLRIKTMLVTYLEYSCKRDFYNPYDGTQDEGDTLAKVRQNYSSYNTIILDSNFIKGKRVANEVSFADNFGNPSRDRSLIKSYNLKYDHNLKVFYNLAKSMNGTFKFTTKVVDQYEIKKFVKEKVYFLQFDGSTFAYYKGNWFHYFKGIFSEVDRENVFCLNGCE
jgi:hypothetical protein